MAVRFTKDADQRLMQYPAAGTEPTSAAGYSMACHVNLASISAGRVFGVGDFSNSIVLWCYLVDANTGGGTDLGGVTLPALTPGTWYFVGFTVSGTTLTIYLGESEGSTALATYTGTVDAAFTTVYELAFGGTPRFGADSFGGDTSGGRIFTSVLTASQMETERKRLAVTSGVWGSWPFVDAATALDDVSGNARNLTASSVAVASATDPVLSSTVTASIAATLGVPTSSIAGTVSPATVTAVIAATLDAPASAITATAAPATVTASISATLGAPASALSGTASPATVTAAIAATLAAPASAISAIVSPPTVTASIAGTLDVPVSAITGTVSAPGVSASIAATLEAPASAIAATASAGSVTAAISGTLDAPVSALTGYTTVAGSITATLEAPASSLTATAPLAAFTPIERAVVSSSGRSVAVVSGSGARASVIPHRTHAQVSNG